MSKQSCGEESAQRDAAAAEGLSTVKGEPHILY